jgi:phosphate/sulfate permease
MWFLIFIVAVLFVLAVTDLIVGVSNDAVNFLNSAIGSQAASFRTIILIASAGVIAGAVFSSGIMEVARTGIFYPQFFTLDKILLVFLAVMLTDVVLLDVFNTLGLPTSTTVSVIFELLGAAMMTGILITFQQNQPAGNMLQFINASSVVTIIAGIFLSVFIAFVTGTIVQYVCRLLFTFRYEERLRRFGALFAGLGITAIVYFLLIKGLRGTTLVTAQQVQWVQQHTLILLLALFAAGFIVTLLLQRLFLVNPLKVVVLLGTFALAMAFAGNDLVNFIGVPITGYLAFANWQQSGVPATAYYMDYLAGADVVVPNYMLLLAGLIMALTLWFSSKARNVTETEVKLGSQQEGEERFQPNAVSRSIVKTSMLLASLLRVLVPKNVRRSYNISFEKSRMRQATIVHNKPAFDLVRAAVNLVLASSIIAVATSYKLPLSTTYVSFMVAMGSSLADKAWGRDTAVYRVAGVLSVLGGWLITAVIAFTASALFAFILITGGIVATFMLLAVVVLYIVASHIWFARRLQRKKKEAARLQLADSIDVDIFQANRKKVVAQLQEVASLYEAALKALQQYDAAASDEVYQQVQELQQYGYKLRAHAIRSIKSLTQADKRTTGILLYSSDLLEDLFSSLLQMAEECRHYIHNLHDEPDADFLRITEGLSYRMLTYFRQMIHSIQAEDYSHMHDVKTCRDDVRNFINDTLEARLNRIHGKQPPTRQGVLETTILLQSRDLLAVTLRILQLFRKYSNA